MADLDLVLAQRLERLATARGWTEEEALARAVERGLASLEVEDAKTLAEEEADVLKAAIAALEEIPTDAFAAIGKAPPGDGSG
jgi:hypothetical protein